MISRSVKRTLRRVARRAGLSAAVLFLGTAAMMGLARMKKPPAQARVEERALTVEAVVAHATDAPVTITGYGDVHALDRVSISPEVSGKVVDIHPRLEPGEIIPENKTLLLIDPRDYRAAVQEAEAAVKQAELTAARLETQLATDERRLRKARRNSELAEAEFTRLKRLFEEDNVGTQAGVEGAERAFNAAEDLVDQLSSAVELYPVRIEETESARRAAEARAGRARTALSRCEIMAPFTARLTDVRVEKGRVVTPGMELLTAVDDSMLEIHVPVAGDDARRWLRFSEDAPAAGTAWFADVEPVDCRVRWTEDEQDPGRRGRLHRVVAYDRDTRTVTLAVRVAGEEARAGAGRVPLTEGMFCRVDIPGRDMRDVVRLPRWAVTFEQTAFLAVSNRLHTVPVRVARMQGEETFVESGIRPGQTVIVTRLVNPLENSLLDIKLQHNADAPSPN